MKIKAALLGVPLDLGAENLGVETGPHAFREQNVVEKLKNSGMDIDDLGDIVCHPRSDLEIGNPKLKYLTEITRVSNEAAKKVNDLIKQEKKVILLGGDHSIALGGVSGASVALQGDLGLIYFDAHGDINTEETTLSGNIHGMHLASLLGFGNQELTSVYDNSVKIKKENLLHIGAYDLDPAESSFMEKENLRCYTMFDILSSGCGPLFQYIDTLQSQVKNIWISLDLDSIDSVYAPAAAMPNKAGLTYREIATIAKYIGERCNVVGVDVVEYNPLQDVNAKTAELGIELIAKFFGHNYSWYTKYMQANRQLTSNS